jgi:hypothetical protein
MSNFNKPTQPSKPQDLKKVTGGLKEATPIKLEPSDGKLEALKPEDMGKAVGGLKEATPIKLDPPDGKLSALKPEDMGKVVGGLNKPAAPEKFDTSKEQPMKATELGYPTPG